MNLCIFKSPLNDYDAQPGLETATVSSEMGVGARINIVPREQT